MNRSELLTKVVLIKCQEQGLCSQLIKIHMERETSSYASQLPQGCGTSFSAQVPGNGRKGVQKQELIARHKMYLCCRACEAVQDSAVCLHTHLCHPSSILHTLCPKQEK